MLEQILISEMRPTGIKFGNHWLKASVNLGLQPHHIEMPGRVRSPKISGVSKLTYADDNVFLSGIKKKNCQ